jgi:hypothetical protein
MNHAKRQVTRGLPSPIHNSADAYSWCRLAEAIGESVVTQQDRSAAMKIDVLPRSVFEKLMGTRDEKDTLEHYRVIFIQNSIVFDTTPPSTEGNLLYPDLLCLSFDNILDESLRPEDVYPGRLFSRQDAMTIALSDAPAVFPTIRHKDFLRLLCFSMILI